MVNPSYGRAFVPRPRQPGSASPPGSSGAPSTAINGRSVTDPSGRSASRAGEAPTVESPPFPPPTHTRAATRASRLSTRYGQSEPRHSREEPEDLAPPSRSNPRRGWNWLLLIPIVMPLLTPLYNRLTPELWGIPFFYWYQLGCAVLATIVIAVVYQLTKVE